MATIITHPQSREYDKGWEAVFGKKTLLRLLQDLGETQQEVADTLKRGGHTGRARQSCECPVANYLRAHCRSQPHVNAGSVVLVEPETDATIEVVTTPYAVGDFILAFDKGDYPELIQHISNAFEEGNGT